LIQRADVARESLDVWPDDAELVARAQRSPAAFTPLYARYVGAVYGYCLQRLGSREAAEDATSQTFAQALAGLSRYRDNSFRGWLFTIARHVVADLQRQRPSAQIDDAVELVDTTLGPEEHAIAAEARRRLNQHLGQLTPEQREIVELRLAGLTGPEIARALGRRPEAIKSAQFRAFQRLRKLLSDGQTEKENRHEP
jgi:RNA polymerase sigma-70 factor, ECF subfamily